MNQSDDATCFVQVNLTNPGQYFACCGLLELADRLWGGAAGWFEPGKFILRPEEPRHPGPYDLRTLIANVASAELIPVDKTDRYSTPIEIQAPVDLTLDWWKDTRANGERLKVWAGTMSSIMISRAMQGALREVCVPFESIFDLAMIVNDAENETKKREPFYFDARRGTNSQSVDVGFSTDQLSMNSVAFPAVEFLCLIGLQRFRPATTEKHRIFLYFTWKTPLDPRLASVAACGKLPGVGGKG